MIGSLQFDLCNLYFERKMLCFTCLTVSLCLLTHLDFQRLLKLRPNLPKKRMRHAPFLQEMEFIYSKKRTKRKEEKEKKGGEKKKKNIRKFAEKRKRRVRFLQVMRFHQSSYEFLT